MPLNSISFLIFFSAVVLAHFLMPQRFRWALLLLASYFFCMSWKTEYVIPLLSVTAVNYYCASKIPRASEPRAKKKYLAIVCCTSLGLLLFFKYFNFFSQSVHSIFHFFGVEYQPIILEIALPVGISFYTFQMLGYAIDVNRRQVSPEMHFGVFALYGSFFPQLIAGPIGRADKLISQFHTAQIFNRERIWFGLQLMGWGLFKKVVIADWLAIYVNHVFKNPDGQTGPTLIISIYFFAFQIYCDFSGYSDIAIGAGRVLGLELIRNFNRPYFSKSIVDFWRRWHISLSTWLRDYLYIPLGGNRKGTQRTYTNILIVFILCGLWHGAAWTFVTWGALNGLAICLSKRTLPFRDRVYKQLNISPGAIKTIRTILTFHIVCLFWIFFRSETLSGSFLVIMHLLQGWPKIFIHSTSMIHGILGIALLIAVEISQRNGPIIYRISLWPLPIRWALYVLFLFSIVLFGVKDGSQFIYSQF